MRSGRPARRASATSGSTSRTNVWSGARPPVADSVQLAHGCDAEPARAALVGERRVDVAVADHPRAAQERRADHALGELGTRGREQRRLRPRRHLGTVEQQLADPLAERRAAGLAHGDDLVTLPGRPLGEQRRLGRLAGAVDAFERHEHSEHLRYGRMRAIVTGGAGFIGSNLVDRLVERGDEVVTVDDLSSGKRENVNAAATFVERDIRHGVEFGRADVVFHLAAQADVQTSLERPDHDAAVNVVGTVQVLEAARRAGAQVVFSSTGGAIYGECDGPASEDGPLEPLSPYGIAKLCGEQYLRGWNRIHGTGHVVLRFGNVFGPRQEASLEGGVVSIFLERMARGEPTTIFGDGGQTRDFVFVGDVVDALLAAVGHDGGVFNVGTGRETSVLELHRACAEVAGSDAEPRFAPRRLGDVLRSVLDVERAERELGWRATTEPADGLRATRAWMTA